MRGSDRTEQHMYMKHKL